MAFYFIILGFDVDSANTVQAIKEMIAARQMELDELQCEPDALAETKSLICVDSKDLAEQMTIVGICVLLVELCCFLIVPRKISELFYPGSMRKQKGTFTYNAHK